MDRDEQALAFIDEGRDVGINEIPAGLLTTRRIDLVNDTWPYTAGSVGAILSVHWNFEALIEDFAVSLHVDGFLLLETVDGHGSNHLGLPAPGHVIERLGDRFDVRFLRERDVGPAEALAVSTSLFAVKSRA
jgi:hypothetical protein